MTSNASVEHCISWTPPTNANGVKSTPFTIQKNEWNFILSNGRCFECDYRLYLESNCNPDKPFKLSVHVAIGMDTVSREEATVRQALEIIWKGHISEISKVVPVFEQQDFLFKIVVCDNTEPANKSVQTPSYFDAKFELESLSGDFAKLLQDEDSIHQDVELVCGDRTLKAHGSLLSARSQVFRAMLQSSMVEAKTGRVEIRDADPDLFQEFLQYLYTGQIPDLTVDTALQFYEMGDRYSVAGMKKRYASFLMDNLTRENACVVLSFADRHSDQEFRQTVVKYILNEKIPMYNEYWSDFRQEFPQLAFEIYDKFLSLAIVK